MRIVILTDKADRHFYFVNTLIEQTGGVVGVITGAKHARLSAKQRKNRRQPKILWARMRNKALNALFYLWGRKLAAEKAAAEKEAFGGSKAAFESRFSHLHLARVEPGRSVNDPDYVEQIRVAKPDVIVVMGTCMIGKAIIQSAPKILNIHTGLSPYYRGGLTNLWPIMHDDYGYFGVTVHELSLGIDSGAIIHTAQPDVQPDDNYARINCRCIQLGAQLMVRALKDLEHGTLGSVPQWEKGKLFFDRDYNHTVAFRYFGKRDRFLAEYRRRAAAGELPRLKLVNNGQLSC